MIHVLLVIGYASILRHRSKTSGCNIWPVASNLTSGIYCVVVFHLIVLEFGCWTVETEKQTYTIWKQIYLSANNVNVILSGPTAIVQVWFVDPWATNNTFHWLNWTPLVNWYALKIPSRNSEIEHFSSNVSWIDVLCSWPIIWLIVAYWERLNGITKTACVTVQHFRTECFFCSGKIITWRNPSDFLWKRVSVLSIFIATAYDILRFSTICELKKVNSMLNILILSATCLFTRQMIHRHKSNWFSIVHWRRTSWRFPGVKYVCYIMWHACTHMIPPEAYMWYLPDDREASGKWSPTPSSETESPGCENPNNFLFW